MSDLLASVIVPVYQAEQFLADAFGSLEAQTCREFETILVDDGSTDGSGAMCDAFCERFPRVTVLHRENRGVSAARNLGLQQAKGRYLVFLDADDMLHPKFMELLKEASKKEPVLVGWRMESGERPSFSDCGDVPMTLEPLKEGIRRIVRDGDFAGYIGCKAFLRQRVTAPFDQRIRVLEDLLFSCENLLQKAEDGCFCFLDASLYWYRQTTVSALHQGFSAASLTSLEAEDRVVDLLDRAGFAGEAACERNRLLQRLCVSNKKLLMNRGSGVEPARWRQTVKTLWKKHKDLPAEPAGWTGKLRAYRLLLTVTTL